MRVLIVGAGAIGEAICRVMKLRWAQQDTVADVLVGDWDVLAARALCAQLDDRRFRAVQLDARDSAAVAGVLAENDIQVLVNVCGPQFNTSLMRGCVVGGADYLDTASDYPSQELIATHRLAEPLLGAAERLLHDEFVGAGLRAFQGFGAVPGMAGIMARFVSDTGFDSIDSISVLYGGNLSMPGGGALAFPSSVADVVATCIQPATVFRDGTFTQVAAFADLETLELPDGIGSARFGLAEIEEVAHIGLNAALFKGVRHIEFRYAPGEQLLNALDVIRALGLDKTEPILVDGTYVSPVAVLSAAAPDPREHSMEYVGATLTGVLVDGHRAGQHCRILAYQAADNQDCLRIVGVPAVDAQTAATPAVMVELLARGDMRNVPVGIVQGPMLDPKAYLALLSEYGFPITVTDAPATS